MTCEHEWQRTEAFSGHWVQWCGRCGAFEAHEPPGHPWGWRRNRMFYATIGLLVTLIAVALFLPAL